MSKNSKANRQRKIAKNGSRKQLPAKSRAIRQRFLAPSAQTLWRSMHLDFRLDETVGEALRTFQPDIWQRDGPAVQRIEQAPDIDAVLDLVPDAMGLADVAWAKRMREFGPEAADAIAARINGDWLRAHSKDRSGIQERLIGALRWCDDRGIEALLNCWDALDDYGRSLASMVLGLSGVHQSGDRVWACYQATRSTAEKLFVGPLWGLIDLADPRAADALIELLEDKREFYEKYGFVSRAGDHRVVLPLIAELLFGIEKADPDVMWALTGVAHRMGRETFTRHLMSDVDVQESRGSKVALFVDRVFQYSAEDVETHFETFYTKDVDNLLDLANAQSLLRHASGLTINERSPAEQSAIALR